MDGDYSLWNWSIMLIRFDNDKTDNYDNADESKQNSNFDLIWYYHHHWVLCSINIHILWNSFFQFTYYIKLGDETFNIIDYIESLLYDAEWVLIKIRWWIIDRLWISPIMFHSIIRYGMIVLEPMPIIVQSMGPLRYRLWLMNRIGTIAGA